MIFLLTFRFSYEKNYSLIVYHVPVPLLNALFFIISLLPTLFVHFLGRKTLLNEYSFLGFPLRASRVVGIWQHFKNTHLFNLILTYWRGLFTRFLPGKEQTVFFFSFSVLSVVFLTEGRTF